MSAKKRNSTRASASRKKRVTFRLEAPEAEQVFVTGSFCDWQEDVYPLRPTSKGVWQKVIYLEPGRHEYRFVVDGKWRNDPDSQESVPNPHGSENSVKVVPA